jgi:osmotically-inducible protein OsmY
MKRILIAGLLAASTVFAAEQGQQQEKANREAADNTGRNAKQQLTAQDQSEAPHDRDLAKRIRSALVKDRSLSTYAKNVKVISRNGKVTLRGPVHSDQERQAVESVATGIAGKENVRNELDVKANQ